MKTLDDLLPDIGYIIVEKEAGGNLWLDCRELKAAIRIEIVQVIKDMTDGIIPINEPRS